GIILFGMMEPNQLVRAAVHDQYRDFESRELGAGAVLDGGDPSHRQPREQFSPYIRQAGECALQNHTGQWLADSQFAGDAAAKRFTESDDIFAREAFLLKPLVSGFRIEIGSKLTGPAKAT